MIRHLQDVAGLEPLQKIARDLGVVISATGDVARRLYTRELRTPTLPAPDLFELTPFATRIELVHSGGSELDDAVTRAIMRELTMPECFTWRIRSAKADARARRVSSYGPMIPTNGIRLSTSGGFEDPMGARRDIASGVYRYVRNPLYHESPSYRANRDLEVFGAIAFLRIAAEAEVDLETGNPVLVAIQETFREAMNWDTLARLQESAALRARLHRALRELCVAACTRASRRMIDESELRRFLGFIDGERAVTTPTSDPGRRFGTLGSSRTWFINDPAPSVSFFDDLRINGSSAITVSERILGDVSRLPQHLDLLLPDTLPIGDDGGLLRSLTSGDVLADGIVPLRVSSWVRLMNGRPGSPRSSQGTTNEMLHFAYLDTSAAGASDGEANDEDMSVLLLMRSGDETESVSVAGPLAVCTSHRYELQGGATTRLLAFRLACGSAIERDASLDASQPIQMAMMVAMRRIEDLDSEAEARVPVATADQNQFKNLAMNAIKYREQNRSVGREQYGGGEPMTS